MKKDEGRRKKPASRYVYMRGNRWRLILGRPPKNLTDGYCEPTERCIYVRTVRRRNLVDTNIPSTAIHEVLHACQPDLDERAVEEIEAALMAVLKLVG